MMSGSMGSERRSKARKFQKKKKREFYTEKQKNIARSKGEDASDIKSWGDSRLKADKRAEKIAEARKKKEKKK